MKNHFGTAPHSQIRSQGPLRGARQLPYRRTLRPTGVMPTLSLWHVRFSILW